MKQNIRPVFTGLFFLALCAFLFSFSEKKGGDSFEIYVNGRLVLQQYVAVAKTVQNLELGRSFSNEKIDVYYSHCGQTGKGRTISIRNAQNVVLKQWQFPDVTTKAPMTCQVKDILALQKNKDTKLNLYYSSKEMPAGRLLAVISGPSEKTAAVSR